MLLFAVSPTAGENGEPLRTLVAFDRVAASKGEAAAVEFELEAKHLMLADAKGEWQAHKGAWTLEVEVTERHAARLLVV